MRVHLFVQSYELSSDCKSHKLGQKIHTIVFCINTQSNVSSVDINMVNKPNFCATYYWVISHLDLVQHEDKFKSHTLSNKVS